MPVSAVALSLCGMLAGIGGPVFQHAGNRVQVDGRLDEWSTLPIRISDPQLALPERNTLGAGFSWERGQLCLGLRMHDLDLLEPPAAIGPYQFHLSDSVQLYLDVGANSSTRMDEDDFNLLLLPDGRAAALRGDELLAQITGAQVPQRLLKTMSFDYAARRTAEGWEAELCLPAAAVGLKDWQSGQQLRLDLAMNDWLRPAAPLGTESESQALQRLLGQGPAHEPRAEALQTWSWSGQRDFGYPQHWLVASLEGGPGLWQRLHARLQEVSLVLLVMVGTAFGLLWLQGRRHRRAMSALFERISALPAVAADSGPNTVAEVQVEQQPRFDPVEHKFALGVLAYVRAHLADNLTPESLAAQFHVSLRTLQRRLRAGLDTRPQELVTAARLEAADQLLVAGELKIQVIAAQVGFDDPAHFARRYREHFGCTPSQRRLQAGKGTS